MTGVAGRAVACATRDFVLFVSGFLRGCSTAGCTVAPHFSRDIAFLFLVFGDVVREGLPFHRDDGRRAESGSVTQLRRKVGRRGRR